jgi:hypothetical protein
MCLADLTDIFHMTFHVARLHLNHLSDRNPLLLTLAFGDE